MYSTGSVSLLYEEKTQINLKNIKGEHDIVIDEYVDFPLVIEKLKHKQKGNIFLMIYIAMF